MTEHPRTNLRFWLANCQQMPVFICLFTVGFTDFAADNLHNLLSHWYNLEICIHREAVVEE